MQNSNICMGNEWYQAWRYIEETKKKYVGMITTNKNDNLVPSEWRLNTHNTRRTDRRARLTNGTSRPELARHGGVEQQDEEETKQEPNHGVVMLRQRPRHALHCRRRRRHRRRRRRLGTHPLAL